MAVALYAATICLYFFLSVNGQIADLPRFFTPNVLDAEGNLCSASRPSRTLKCPVFGIKINKGNSDSFIPYSQKEIEAQCANLKFPGCTGNEKLFPDGVCRVCPTGHVIDGDGTGDLFCVNTNDTSKTIRYTNPFNCGGANEFQRETQNIYRPCYSSATAPQVTLAEYYKRNDFNQVLTMAACQKNMPVVTTKTVVTQNAKTSSYDFNLILKTSHELPYGFVQCPRKPQTYNFSSIGWILLYVFLAVSATILLSYSVYKKMMEKNFSQSLKQDQSNVTRDATIGEEVDVEILETKMRMVGYNNDMFGTIAYYTFWSTSWLWHFLFLLLTLDEYGMLIGTLCPSVPFGSCSYNWRTGFGCASGCLFSWNWLGGIYSEWPYESASGGIAQLYATVFVLSAIMAIWWIATLIFYSNLKFIFRVKCSIEAATHVVVYKRKEKELRLDSDEHTVVSKILRKLDSITGKSSNNEYDMETCEVKKDASSKYFVFQCLKYTFDNRSSTYNLIRVNVANTHNEFQQLSDKGLSSSSAMQIRQKVGDNQISFQVPSVPQSIWNEFFSMFYIYQFVFLWLWYNFFYWLMAFVLTVVVIIAGTISIVVTRESQKNMKKMSEVKGIVTALRDGKWIQLRSQEVLPGDVLKLHSGESITCDSVLVSGRCVMNESALTGEPTPVPKIPVNNSTQSFGSSSEDLKYSLLSGTRVESVSVGKFGDTRCVVVATGAQTKQGELVRSMLYPPKLRFKFDDHIRVVFLIMGFIAIFTIAWIAFVQYFKIITIYYGLFTVSQMFSPLIPAIFAAGQARCSSTLKKKNIFCVELARTYVSAKVKTFCFDKTGTLTKQGMEFYGVCPLQSNNLFAEVTRHPSLNMQKYLGCCHELEFLSNDGINSLAGNEVDIAMYESSGFTFESIHDDVSVIKKDNSIFSILKRFEFNRDLMLMSVIVESNNGQRSVFTKGSYEKVAERCKPETVPTNFAQRTSELAMQGYYVLGIAEGPLDNQMDILRIHRDTVEKDLTFVGLILFKNDLKMDTAEVLDEMREGNIRNVMITGDNVYTACSIAKESRLSCGKQIIYGDVEVTRGPVVWRYFPDKTVVSPIGLLQRAADISDVDLAITGPALNTLLHTPYESLAGKGEAIGSFLGVSGKTDAMRYLLPYMRIFSRMKPAQKVEVVKLHMERAVTGMCGDGANDAAALRIAHCGVAVASGSNSATIVAPFSSANSSIGVAAEVVRQGRGALSSAFAGYKRLIMYGQMLFAIKVFLYHGFLQLSETAWILIDSFINVGFSLTILLSHSASKLTPNRPTSKLLGLELFMSIIFQIAILFAMIITGMSMLLGQDWYACKNFDVSLANLAEWWTMGDNYEGAVLAVVGVYQMINMGFVYNHGFEYRKWWFKNYGLMALWAIYFALWTAILFSPPNFLSCLFRMNCGDASVLTRWDKLKDIGFKDSLLLPFSDYFPNSFAPVGCPCTETIAYTGALDTCEREYISCSAPHYNQSD
ncbi:haloacid dehalogenase family hydrolase domain-containing protein [Cardiosporidium cionae]|uniref:Haloacid dehalogenase family hydrolase domain-containing protein n=1 Tax=Cardiosporidium cionae TaxID=476202 RepID=A0ABQ7J967_9APIC|nr:haloacid dehalogenase family hydrolase domain-containing protein [Cardiosporidium cionae]|eukprot:KAF8820210.1 haloacid dehalogenase family hydrolase domain-containing protein [Cardiosporidium cionae]